jgi:hypothetical protein
MTGLLARAIRDDRLGPHAGRGQMLKPQIFARQGSEANANILQPASMTVNERLQESLLIWTPSTRLIC